MALEPNELPEKSVLKFESMLQTDQVYFFDSEEFEEITHHYLNHGKVNLGKKAVEMGLQQHPNSIELQLLHIEILVYEDQYEEACDRLDLLEAIDPSNEEIFIQRANICSKRDDHIGAINLLMEALHFAEDGYDIYSLLGMEYLFIDDYPQARKCFSKCLEYDPQDYSSLYNVVYCYEFMEDYTGGIHFLNRYLDRNPYCEVAWHQLGKMYCTLQMWKEALAAFDFAIISDEQFIGAYFEKAHVLEQLERYREAIECYEITLTLDDPTSHAYLRMGLCYEKLRNMEQARWFLNQTVHEDPLLDKAWIAITEHHIRAGNVPKALSYIEKALSIDSENPQYWILKARILESLKRYPDAIVSYDRAIEKGEFEIDSFLGWADLLRKQNQLEQSLKVLQEAMEIHPEESRLYFVMSGIYLKLGKNEKAKSAFRKGLEINPAELREFETRYSEHLQLPWVTNMFGLLRKTST